MAKIGQKWRFLAVLWPQLGIYLKYFWPNYMHTSCRDNIKDENSAHGKIGNFWNFGPCGLVESKKRPKIFFSVIWTIWVSKEASWWEDFKKYQLEKNRSIFEVKIWQKPSFFVIKCHFPRRPNGGDLFDNGFGTLRPMGKMPHSQFFSYISFGNPYKSDHCDCKESKLKVFSI